MAVFVLDVLSLSEGIRVQTLPTTQRCVLVHFLQNGHIATLNHNHIYAGTQSTHLCDILQRVYLNIVEFVVAWVVL